MSPDAQQTDPTGTGILLHDTEWFSMTYQVGLNILVMKRKSRAIDSLAHYQAECEQLGALMDENRDVRGVVIDMRDAQARQDSDYEQASAKVREKTFALFPRVAMLFRSVAGSLQMRRFAGDRGEQLLSTTDEAEAMQFARGRFTEPPRSR